MLKRKLGLLLVVLMGLVVLGTGCGSDGSPVIKSIESNKHMVKGVEQNLAVETANVEEPTYQWSVSNELGTFDDATAAEPNFTPEQVGQGKLTVNVNDLSASKTIKVLSTELEDTYGGVGNDRFEAVLATEDDGYLAAGYDKEINKDAYAVKANSQGIKSWEVTFDGNQDEDDDRFTSVESIKNIFNDEHLLIGYQGSDVSTDAYTGYVMRIDKDGNQTKEYSQVIGDRCFLRDGVVDQGKENLVIVGNEGVSSSADGYIFRIDLNSGEIKNEEKNLQIGSGDYTNFRSITKTDNGNYIVAGYTTDANGNNQGILVKFDSDLNKEKEVYYGKELYTVKQNSDGNYVAVGEKLGEGYVVEIASDWTFNTDKTFSDAKEFRDFQELSDGYLFVGYYGDQGYMVKANDYYSQDGASKNYGEGLYSIDETSNGNYYLAGKASGDNDDSDAYIVKVDANGEKVNRIQD